MRISKFVLTATFAGVFWSSIRCQSKPLSSMEGELEALDGGIKNVKVIKCNTFFLEKYFLRVEQPVDHKKESSLTFT